MTVKIIYSDALKELAEPRPRDEYKKNTIARVARAAGLHYWRAYDIWYLKARRIDAEEARRIDDALQQKREDEAVNEISELRTRLLKIESRIAAEAPSRAGAALGQARARPC
ncbi:hypothetical protein [uncultured Bradyrhizobium sp.]|uniref:hypothetical protein n=1 Tax=uncultured Bradyrhizobium sp. TaxID=199684 RepID=UPI0035CC6A3C